MSKSDILTSDEVREYPFSPETLELLQAHGERIGREPGELTTLDWGSGRGRAVGWLRERGYQAFGVDVDPVPIRHAAEYFTHAGWEIQSVLRLIDSRGGTGFGDGFFDFAFSDQVLEHVKDLGAVARELYRVMAPGAEGLHTFPARFRVVEPHLFMLFVHWLPKNRIRRAFIGLCLRLGLDPRWKALRGQPWSDRTRVYHEYSVAKTHYRSPGEISRIFLASGFEIRFTSLHHRARLEKGIFRIPGFRKAAIWVLNRFFTTQIVIRKPAGNLG
jgi:SAM-dependent methyltransferase